MIPLTGLYHKDRRIRRECGLEREKNRLSVIDGILLFMMGGGLALAANFILSFFSSFLRMEQYSEQMNMFTGGHSIWILLLWIGILGPISEELLFRWLIYKRFREHYHYLAAAVLSGLLFGIYHGNPAQFIYAALLGIVFAVLLEWTGNIWSSALLHMGANIWSLVISDYGQNLLSVLGTAGFLCITYGMILLLAVGIRKFGLKFQNKG